MEPVTEVKLYSAPGRDVAGFSHEGISYTPDESGAFLVPLEALEVAMLHGLTTAAPEPQTPTEPKAPDAPQDPADQQQAPAPSLQEILDGLKNKGDVAAFALVQFGLTLDPDAMKRDEMEAAILKAAEPQAPSTQEA